MTTVPVHGRAMTIVRNCVPKATATAVERTPSVLAPAAVRQRFTTALATAADDAGAARQSKKPVLNKDSKLRASKATPKPKLERDLTAHATNVNATTVTKRQHPSTATTASRAEWRTVHAANAPVKDARFALLRIRPIRHAAAVSTNTIRYRQATAQNAVIAPQTAQSVPMRTLVRLAHPAIR